MKSADIVHTSILLLAIDKLQANQATKEEKLKEDDQNTNMYKQHLKDATANTEKQSEFILPKDSSTCTWNTKKEHIRRDGRGQSI